MTLFLNVLSISTYHLNNMACRRKEFMEISITLFLNVLSISTYHLNNMACRRKEFMEISISAFLVVVNLTIFGHANITAIHVILNKVCTMINTGEC